jgi:hypothetical protein
MPKTRTIKGYKSDVDDLVEMLKLKGKAKKCSKSWHNVK